MIVGDTSVFAIESSITRAYERLSFRALGFFVIYITGRCYGIRSSEATLLANSADEVERRIARRGSHTAPFASSNADEIAHAVRRALYTECGDGELFFGMPLAHFKDVIRSQHLLWAPDGDEAFDDGSYVLHFDVEDRVRLIAFTSTSNSLFDPASLRDAWLLLDDFYRILRNWRDRFEVEWASLPKAKD